MHVRRKWRLGAKEDRIPSVARIGPGATRLGEEKAPIVTDAVSQLACLQAEAAQQRRLVSINAWPPGFGSNASKSSPAAQHSTQGALLKHNPQHLFSAQA